MKLGIMMDGIFNNFPWSGTRPARASVGPTNEVVSTIAGIRHKRLGNSGLVVSEVGLGTQRWGSADFNAPGRDECHRMMDLSVLGGGVNLIDTAEQYPIPSDGARPEGSTESIIGEWIAKGDGRRSKLVIATKVTGGRRVSRKGIIDAVDGSLKRLGSDYIDLVQTHWPARYSPQSNWGQSLAYHRDGQRGAFASFDEITETFGELVRSGKIRGYGFCNDNAVGLVASAEAAKRLGVPGPCVMQNDFSLVDRRMEENGVAEASAPCHFNAGFFGYNALAGGVLTGKYLKAPPAWESRGKGQSTVVSPPRARSRYDDESWGRTLYRYRSGPAEEATRQYEILASRYGMSLMDLSLRWCCGREALTSVLLGSSNVNQLSEGLASFRRAAEAPLPEELLWEIDRVHMRNRLPIFSSYDVGVDWDGEGQIGERIP